MASDLSRALEYLSETQKYLWGRFGISSHLIRTAFLDFRGKDWYYDQDDSYNILENGKILDTFYLLASRKSENLFECEEYLAAYVEYMSGGDRALLVLSKDRQVTDKKVWDKILRPDP